MAQDTQKNEPPVVLGGQGRSSESLADDGVAIALTLALAAAVLGVVAWLA